MKIAACEGKNMEQEKGPEKLEQKVLTSGTERS